MFHIQALLVDIEENIELLEHLSKKDCSDVLLKLKNKFPEFRNKKSNSNKIIDEEE